MSIRFSMGALADDVKTQVENQGLSIDAESARFLDELLHRVTYLRIHSVITDGEAHKAYKRVVKLIGKAIDEHRAREKQS